MEARQIEAIKEKITRELIALGRNITAKARPQKQKGKQKFQKLIGQEISVVPNDGYGGGCWFVIGESEIWWIINNGADGDLWSQNNIDTGGAGAIGACVPFTEELASQILSLHAAMPKIDALVGALRPQGI